MMGRQASKSNNCGINPYPTTTSNQSLNSSNPTLNHFWQPSNSHLLLKTKFETAHFQLPFSTNKTIGKKPLGLLDLANYPCGSPHLCVHSDRRLIWRGDRHDHGNGSAESSGTADIEATQSDPSAARRGGSDDPPGREVFGLAAG